MTIGILLAGGQSSRFKEDKALYVDPDYHKSWGRLQSEKLLALTDETYVVANQKNQQELKNQLAMYNITVTLDDPKYFGEGPLSGLYRVAKETKEHDFLVLGIDYPDVTTKELQQLLFVKNCYAIDGNLTPHYTLCHLSFHYLELKEFLETGNRRLRDFLKEQQTKECCISKRALFNYNTPPKKRLRP